MIKYSLGCVFCENGLYTLDNKKCLLCPIKSATCINGIMNLHHGGLIIFLIGAIIIFFYKVFGERETPFMSAHHISIVVCKDYECY